MKYLRLFESEQLQVGDIVICNKDFSTEEDFEGRLIPRYEEKYLILRIYKYLSQTFLEIKEVGTGGIIRGWNIQYFTSEYEWNANKYNL